jgi:hypothetical protein
MNFKLACGSRSCFQRLTEFIKHFSGSSLLRSLTFRVSINYRETYSNFINPPYVIFYSFVYLLCFKTALI